MRSGSSGRVITLGGKGSSLSSAAVFEVANSFSLLRIDSSSKFSSSTSNSTKTSSSNSFPNYHFSLPDYLTLEESRASLLVLLNRLLLSSSTSISVTHATAAASLLLDVLNRSDLNSPADWDYETLKPILGYCSVDAAAVHGVCALLNHHSSALSSIADAVAACLMRP